MDELSKLIDQLRMAHFTLIVACLVLITATEFSTPSEVQRAYKDLVALQNAARSLPPIWPDDAARSKYSQTLDQAKPDRRFFKHVRIALTKPQNFGKQKIPAFATEAVLVGDYSILEPEEPRPSPKTVRDGNKMTILVNPTPTHLPFSFESAASGGQGEFSFIAGPATFSLKYNPTIAEFADAWEFMRKPHVVVVPTNLQNRIILGGPLIAEGEAVVISSLPDVPQDLQLPDKQWDTFPVALLGAYTVNDEQGWAYILTKEGVSEDWAVPVEVAQYPVDLLAVFVNLTHLAKKPDDTPPQLGSFSDAFPELTAVTKNYSDLPLDKSRSVLESEIARGGSNFEFLGAKFPVASIGVWGLVILFVLEIYFSLNLNEVRGTGSPELLKSTCGWIGLYRNWVAQSLTIISACLFPSWVAFAVGEFSITNVIVAPSRLRVVLVRVGESSVVVAAMIACVQLLLLWSIFRQKARRSLESTAGA